MPLAYYPEIPRVERIDSQYSRRAPAPSLFESDFGNQSFDVLQRELYEIRSAESTYKLREGLNARWLPNYVSGEYKFVAPKLPCIVGDGSTPKSAYKSFQEEFHRTFQELLSKRPFEMSNEEATQWQNLESRVDVPAYLRETPIRIRQCGTVLSNRQGARTIRWEGIRGHETIELDQFPDEFASYRSGQSFEAIVLRDRFTMNLKRVVYVAKQATLTTSSHSEDTALWDAMKKADDLPTHDWR